MNKNKYLKIFFLNYFFNILYVNVINIIKDENQNN